jgi:hypothetical protein
MAWKKMLHDNSRPGTTFLHKEAGVGFYYIFADFPETTQRLLLQAAHQVEAQIVIYQEWVPSFNPFKPYRILIPTWITLWLLPLEFTKLASQNAGSVGRMLLRDVESLKTPTPRFYAGLDLA